MNPVWDSSSTSQARPDTKSSKAGTGNECRQGLFANANATILLYITFFRQIAKIVAFLLQTMAVYAEKI
jgi:hypothetical protein